MIPSFADSSLPNLLAILTLQVTLVATAALLGAALLRSAVRRHSLLLAAVLVVLASPLLLAAARLTGTTLPLAILPPPHAAAPAAELPPPQSVAAQVPAVAPVPTPIASEIPATPEPVASSVVPYKRIDARSNQGAYAPRSPTVATPIAPAARPVEIRLDLALVALWLTGTLVGFLGIGRAAWKTHLLLRSVSTAMSEIPEDVLREVNRRLKIREFPRVATTGRVAGPAVAGLRSWVLIPAACLETLSRDELVQVLIHEGAHVVRRDPLIVLMQRLAAAVFWWHPLVHLVNWQLSRAREEVCDNYVLQHAPPDAYGATLLRLAMIAPGNRVSLAAVALLDGRWNLEDRIRGLLDSRRPASTRGGLLTTATVLAAFAILSSLLAATRVVGQMKDESPRERKQAPPAPPAPPAPKAEVISGIDPGQLRVELLFHGESDKPFYNLVLSVPEVPKDDNAFHLAERIDLPQSKKLLEHLTASGFFKHARKDLKPGEGQGYTLRVVSGETRLQEELGWDSGMLDRLDGLQKALEGTPRKSLDQLLARLSGLRKTWTEGATDDGLKTTLTMDDASIGSGHPVLLTLKVANVGKEPATFGQTMVSVNDVFAVRDENGRPMTWLSGTAQVKETKVTLEPGQSQIVETFDLAEGYYLRRPGKYTVQFRGYGLPESNRLAFEIRPDPAGTADGDPVARLLPLVKEGWTFGAGPSKPRPLRPGSNWSETPCRVFSFLKGPRQLRESSLISLWLAEKQAVEQITPESSLPATESLGKVSRWHAYILVSENAQRDWPTAREDIAMALRDPEQPPSPEEIETAKMGFRKGAQSPERLRAVKVLYPLIKVGSRTLDALNYFGAPDFDEGGQLSRIYGYKVGETATIEIEYDRETELVVRKEEHGLGLDPPRGPTPPISEALKPYLKDIGAGTTTLRTGFVPAKTELVWGEPLELTFTAANIGAARFQFEFGGDYRGVGRHNRFKILVTDARGNELPDPREELGDFGGILAQDVLFPNGKVFTRTIDLTAYRKIEKPGKYTVTCSFGFHDGEPADRKHLPVAESKFTLVILERTPERVSRVLDELVGKARAATDATRDAAMARIAEFGKDDAVPRLVQLTTDGEPVQRAAAIGALPLVPTEESLDAALQSLRDAKPSIRIAAAGALSRFARPAAVDALMSTLPRESSPVKEAILRALGTSKSPQALPVLINSLEGKDDARMTAVEALTEFGGTEAVAALKAHATSPDLVFRHKVLGALAERLGVPLEPEWLLPILMCRTLDHPGWYDARRLTRLYTGARSVPTLLAAVDYDVPWSHRNWWLLQEVEACAGAPKFVYEHDPNSDGTAEQHEKNRQTLAMLEPLAGPIPKETPFPPRVPVPALKTDPPIDFTPTLKPARSQMPMTEITSGFYTIRTRRGGSNFEYKPSEAWKPTYERAAEILHMLRTPAVLRKKGITDEQARELRKLSAPPDYVNVDGWFSQRYSAWLESPEGAVRERAEQDLKDIIQRASQSYHASVVAFVEGAKPILEPAAQPARGQQIQSRAADVFGVERIDPAMRERRVWLDLRERLAQSPVKFRWVEVNEKGVCRLSLAVTPATDLSHLKGMPLEFLDLSNTGVRDLSPLEGMPLKVLDLSGSQVVDLRPLKGMKLTRLNLAGAKAFDLSPLVDAKLESLVANGPINNLAPLAGQPLKYLDIRRTQVRDLSPLAKTPLESLQLEDSPVEDLSPLKGLPLAMLWLGDFQDKHVAQLRGMTLKRLVLTGPAITDASPLKEIKVEDLTLENTSVKDLSPLAGLPLKSLNASGSPVTDLAPLKGMKLTSLYVTEPGVDLAPLADMPLEMVGIPVPDKVENLDVLRALPTLKWIRPPECKPIPVEEFWKGRG